MAKHGDVVILGRCKDALGFPAFVHEDTVTGQRYLSYEPEVFFERSLIVKAMEALGKEVPQEKAQELVIET